MIADETDLDALFKRLHLANARRVWRGLVDRAERERWSYRDFLILLATEEIAHRQQRSEFPEPTASSWVLCFRHPEITIRAIRGLLVWRSRSQPSQPPRA